MKEACIYIYVVISLTALPLTAIIDAGTAAPISSYAPLMHPLRIAYFIDRHLEHELYY